jgi:hypothetical protein
MSAAAAGPFNPSPQSLTLGTAPDSVLGALLQIVDDLPGWENGAAAEIAAKAVAPGTRQFTIRGGVGRPSFEPFPSPREARMPPPAWIETTSDLLKLRSNPTAPVKTGILVEHTEEFWPSGLLAVRFVLAPATFLPIVVPCRVLIDPHGYDDIEDGRLAFADFLREREGHQLAAGSSRAQLLSMYDHVRLLDDRLLIRAANGPGAVRIRGNIDSYTAIAEHGYGGLEAALAATVIQVDQRALVGDDSTASRAVQLLINYAVGRADFAAVSALRLAGLQSRLH